MDFRLRNFKRRAATGDLEAQYGYIAVLEQAIGGIEPAPDFKPEHPTWSTDYHEIDSQVIMRTVHGTELQCPAYPEDCRYVNICDIESGKHLITGVGSHSDPMRTTAFRAYEWGIHPQIACNILKNLRWGVLSVPRPRQRPRDYWYLREWKRLFLESKEEDDPSVPVAASLNNKLTIATIYSSALERVAEELAALPDVVVTDDYPDELVARTVHGTELRGSDMRMVDECSYLRVCTYDGNELAYWSVDEWQEEPEEVMGAIIGSLLSQK